MLAIARHYARQIRCRVLYHWRLVRGPCTVAHRQGCMGLVRGNIYNDWHHNHSVHHSRVDNALLCCSRPTHIAYARVPSAFSPFTSCLGRALLLGLILHSREAFARGELNVVTRWSSLLGNSKSGAASAFLHLTPSPLPPLPITTSKKPSTGRPSLPSLPELCP